MSNAVRISVEIKNAPVEVLIRKWKKKLKAIGLLKTFHEKQYFKSRGEKRRQKRAEGRARHLKRRAQDE